MRAASTVDGDAQRRALTSLFTRFTADRDALASAIRRCEERLDALARGETAPVDGVTIPHDERFRQLEQSVLDATREARAVIEAAGKSLAPAPPPADEPLLATLDQRVGELRARLDALASVEHRMTMMENEVDTRLQTAVTRMAATITELDDKIGRALEQSGRALDRTADALHAPAATGDPESDLTWMRNELDARIEATVSAVKDVRAQLSTRMADVTQRGDEVRSRLGELAARQDALQDGLTAIETRVADVAERLRTVGERLSQVAAIAAQDRQQTMLTRLHARLDALEAGLRRIAPEASWSVPESVARALEPVVPSFLTGWLRNGQR